ncbi:PREDICTED: LOW QUALITY PROTEIN: uncharacterized protein LOC106332061 [Brassica oleracea var. oleracea]|uniref:LOW QUALITY PROTEIN: uncharacterized protein LOC106332061 n=1 Tax=Brassica oleracea var. oleracea TaxID=109376 RepID=UPI0006A72389|nr:PREDICTED: LOW QUALITY PROTEIN: uncharacterized protein LOC106332061 [Brassica oleracea var. oleracea]
MWSAGLGGRATPSGTQDSLQTLLSRTVPIVFRIPNMSRGFAAIILRHPYDERSLDDQVLTLPLNRSCTKENTFIFEPPICSGNPRCFIRVNVEESSSNFLFRRFLEEWIAIMACCLSVVGLLDKKNDDRRWWFWYSCVPGSALTIFWLYYLLRLPKFRWDAIWLPFGPLRGAGTCLYVDHLLEESSEQVKKLRNYCMYAYKAR